MRLLIEALKELETSFAKKAEEFKDIEESGRTHLHDAVFVRFSTVQGSRGSTDLARDVRGFAVKFYTQDSIAHHRHWDREPTL